jgi:hypothetical protein
MTDLEQLLRVADPLRHNSIGSLPEEAVAAVGREISMNSISSAGVLPVGTTDPRGVPAVRARRRRLMVAASLIATGVLGVSTAALAFDAVPGSVEDVFSHLRNDPSVAVDVDAVERAASGPGPDGTRFSVLRVGNANGWTCLGPGFESAASAASPVPTDFNRNGNLCLPSGHRTGPFGGAAGTIAEREDDRYPTYLSEAGAAVRAELHLPDGTTQRALLVDGYFWGWYPRNVGDLTLVGYDGEGNIVGRASVRTR